MKGRVNIWFLSLFALLSCQQVQNKHQKNEHHSQDDEQTMYTLDGLDHGLIQSPVNILTLNTKNHIERDIEISDEKPAISSKVENTRHSVQLDFDEGIVIRLDSNYYNFLQAHFHTPSEHQIDGITYPMEIHFVCKQNSDNPKYLLVGAFFKMGRENAFIKSFIEKIPTSEDEITDIHDDPVFLDELLLPEEPFNDYYYYQGSLTTPPFTESVEWFLIKRILEASPEQIQYINKLEGNNARHVQALFGRKIEQ
ncbi:MAG: carbonic anhydrase family protein [Bacteroidota bacterium]